MQNDPTHTNVDQPSNPKLHKNRAAGIGLMILGVLCWAVTVVLHLYLHPALETVEGVFAIGGAIAFVAGVNRAGI